jgi:hypothetical protein
MKRETPDVDLAQFVIHSIPMDIWVGAQTRAQRERWPLHALCVQLLEDYANGAVTPSGTPDGYTLGLRFDPRTPWRTAVVTTRNPRREQRVQCIAASEAAGYLWLLNHEAELVGRFLSAEVESWFLED